MHITYALKALGEFALILCVLTVVYLACRAVAVKIYGDGPDE